MISTPLVICLAVASAAIVIALMIWKPRHRFQADAKAEGAMWPSREVTFASMLLAFAETIGLARSQAGRSTESNPDSGDGWHGGHLDHGASSGFSGGGHSDGGGFSGGDAGGGGI